MSSGEALGLVVKK